MSHYLYILRSEVKETYYIGVSNDPERRLFFHNNSDTHQHTLRHRPWKLVYSHEFKTKEKALTAEQNVKYAMAMEWCTPSPLHMKQTA